MFKLQKFVENGWDVGEIRRRTGISPHVVKSCALQMLGEIGVKYCEYELLRLICTHSTSIRAVFGTNSGEQSEFCIKQVQSAAEKLVKTGSFGKVQSGIPANTAQSAFENLKTANLKEIQVKIVEKVVQGVGFDDLRKLLGMSPATLKSQLKHILTAFGVEDAEYTLLSELLKRGNASQ